jgi:hypothetical protein
VTPANRGSTPVLATCLLSRYLFTTDMPNIIDGDEDCMQDEKNMDLTK